jgi:DNA-binding transcriptional LysR family regulator
MHVEYFIYFKDFARTLSISQTAANFYMTPQGISRAIHSLEKEFGVTLISRSNNSLSLTAAGLALVSDAEMMEEAFRKSYRHMTTFATAGKGLSEVVISIKVSAFISTYLLPLMNLYSSRLFPFTIRIQESNIYKILPKTKIEEQPHSFALMSIPEIESYEKMLIDVIEKDEFEYLPLLRIPLQALVSVSSPLAGYKRIKTADIKEYPVILYNDPVLFDAITSIIGKKNIIATTSSFQMLQQEIEKNHAITFMPSIAKVTGLPNATVLKPLVGAYSTRVGFLGSKCMMSDSYVVAVMNHIRDFFWQKHSQKKFKNVYQMIGERPETIFMDND